LRVLAALHEIGADLGDPLEIRRTDTAIVVTGVGLPRRRQDEIRRALEPIPHVALEFPEPPVNSLPQEQPPAGSASTSPAKPAGLQSRLEQQFGGRTEFERASAQLLDWNEAAMARAYALRALAQRFPEGAESGMEPADRRTLRDLARSHLAALAAQSGSMEHSLAPILRALGAPAARAGSAAPPPNWQSAAEDVFRSARRVEVLLTQVLGVSRQGAAADSPAELAAALAGLHANLGACRNRLSGE
jgi:hypothetical protein